MAEYIGRAAISAVSLREVAKEILREGTSTERVRPVLDDLGLDVHSHDREAAYAAAALYPQTKQHGRIPGNRSCTAFGLQPAVRTLWADREWAKVEVERLTARHLR